MTTTKETTNALAITDGAAVRYDFFISHASEDRDAIARPLAAQLVKAGFRVWIDEQELRLGDSLRRRVEQGIAESRFGIIILSPAFFAKEWPRRELDALFAHEIGIAGKFILPIWHEIGQAAIAQHSPLIADRIGAPTTDGVEELVRKIVLATGEPARTGRGVPSRGPVLFDFSDLDRLLRAEKKPCPQCGGQVQLLDSEGESGGIVIASCVQCGWEDYEIIH